MTTPLYIITGAMAARKTTIARVLVQHFRASLERLTGPLSDQAFASQVFGLYSGLVYFTPVFGGLLADRLLGQRRTVLTGAAMMVAGHLLMALSAAFLIALLLLLIVGIGCLKGNILVQVGHLYSPEEEGRRTRAFAIFSAAITAGALLGPLTCGIPAQGFGWHVGFGAAGVMCSKLQSVPGPDRTIARCAELETV